MSAALLMAIAQLTVTATAPQIVDIREAVVVRVVARSPSLVHPVVQPPHFAGFSVVGSSASSRIVVAGGSPHVVLELIYRLRAHAAGAHVIAPFQARVDERTSRSDPLTVNVVSPDAPPTESVVRQFRGFSAAINPDRPVNTVVTALPDTVYVGEQVTYEMAIFIDDGVFRQRSPSPPSLVPPDVRGTMSLDIPFRQGDLPMRQVGDKVFRTFAYRRAVFPLVEGTFVVPAASLDYTIPSGGSFMSRDETHTIRTDSAVITAIPLPRNGMPPDFRGAVGIFRVERTLSSLQLAVGEPFTLRARVHGTGNVRLLPRPELDIPWADVVNAGERVEQTPENGVIAGMKEFTWVVTPTHGGPVRLEPIAYPFFNPRTRRYERATTRADSFYIVPAATVEVSDAAPPAEPPPLPGISDRGAERTMMIWRYPWFVLLLALAPLPAVVVGLRRSAARHRVEARAGTLHSHTGGTLPPDEMVHEARRVLTTSIERALQLPSGTSADRRALRAALLRDGVTRETTDTVLRLMDRIDSIAFSSAQQDASRDAADIRHEVDAALRSVASEALSGPKLMSLIHLSLLLLVLLPFSAQAGQERRPLHDAVVLYESGEYRAAAELFLQRSREHPLSSDAWTGLAFSAMQIGDTATAVVALHRSLRLDPVAPGTRALLRRLGPAYGASSNAVPFALPLNTLAALAGAAWVLGWMVFTAYLRIGGRRVAILASAAFSLAALTGGALTWMLVRNADRNVAVVAEALNSRVLPSLESASAARLHPGEVVRLGESRDGWSRVSNSERQLGWVHQTSLIRIVQ